MVAPSSQPPTSLSRHIERMSWLAQDLGPRLLDLEVNPLIVGAKGQGAVAVDGRANIDAA